MPDTFYGFRNSVDSESQSERSNGIKSTHQMRNRPAGKRSAPISQRLLFGLPQGHRLSELRLIITFVPRYVDLKSIIILHEALLQVDITLCTCFVSPCVALWAHTSPPAASLYLQLQLAEAEKTTVFFRL